MVNKVDGKIQTFCIKEAFLPPLGIVLLLREAGDRVLARRADDVVAGIGMDEQYEVEIAAADNKLDQEAIKDKRSLEAIEGEIAIEMIENVQQQAGVPFSSSELQRLPRGSRIYIF